jgi:hypothetical protein
MSIPLSKRYMREPVTRKRRFTPEERRNEEKLVTIQGVERHCGMWAFLRSGGLPMLFILIFGLIALGAAFYFALRAARRSLAFIKCMAAATLFSTLATTCADVGATLSAAGKVYDVSDPQGSSAEQRFTPETARGADVATTFKVMRVVVEGFAESTSPGILGFALLALTSMLVAVGRRRLDDREGAG